MSFSVLLNNDIVAASVVGSPTILILLYISMSITWYRGSFGIMGLLRRKEFSVSRYTGNGYLTLHNKEWIPSYMVFFTESNSRIEYWPVSDACANKDSYKTKSLIRHELQPVESIKTINLGDNASVVGTGTTSPARIHVNSSGSTIVESIMRLSVTLIGRLWQLTSKVDTDIMNGITNRFM